MRLSIGGCEIHHVDAGPPEASAVLLLHGITATHRYWRDNIDHLALRRRVIALDLPGFGLSDKPDAPYSMAWFVDTLVGFLDAKGVRRVSLVGNSMGGQIAVHFATTHPERVERLVLVSPAGAWPSLLRPLERVIKLGFDVLRLTHRGRALPLPPQLSSAGVGLLFRAVFPDRPDLASRHARAYREGIASPEYQAFLRAAFRAAHGVLAAPVHDLARQLTMPTLLLWGARDNLVPVGAATRLHHVIPRSRLLIYRESGHCPMIDQPERWNRDVTAFLDGDVVGE